AMPPLEPTPALRERYERAGLWQHRTIAQLIAAIAAEQPDREAVCDQTRRLTYAELVAESGRLARFLVDAGIDDDDAVAVQSGNRVELSIAHLACSIVRATFVPLSDAWRETETTHILGVSRAAVAIVPEGNYGYDYLAAVASARPRLPSLRAV